MYEFRDSLFDNGETKDLLLFKQNYKMMIDIYGNLSESAKNKYLCTFLRDGALHEFESLCLHIVSTTTTHLNQIILGLGA